ncbi:MAG TPA: hypothetical protein PLS49_07165, partial [Candidatus Woesebacteria bacterium]|nr:hypothetical protein [Candidatus Woesebacteria bacterium]
MSFATVRRYSFCILLLLYIISGIRTVSAEMKGIPRSEEDKICAVFLPSTAQKPLSLNSDILLDKINAHRASL